MLKIVPIPFPILKDNPIVPKDAVETDVAFIEDADEEMTYIVFQTKKGNAVFDSQFNLKCFRNEVGVDGSVQESVCLPVGSTIFEGAREACQVYIESKNDTEKA